jgi:transcriptional regulator with XRE-family HTH domain
LVGRWESWLSQVERGRRSIDSHSVLVRLAEILGVEVSQLTPTETETATVKYEACRREMPVSARPVKAGRRDRGTSRTGPQRFLVRVRAVQRDHS